MINQRRLDYGCGPFCAYTVFIKPRDDTTCYLSNNHVTGSVEIGHLGFVFGIDVGDV